MDEVEGWQNSWWGSLMEIGRTAVDNLTQPRPQQQQQVAQQQSWFDKVDWKAAGLFVLAALVGLLLLRRLLA